MSTNAPANSPASTAAYAEVLARRSMQERLNKLGKASVVLGGCSFIAGFLGVALPLAYWFFGPDEEPPPGNLDPFDFVFYTAILFWLASWGLASAGLALAVGEKRINSTPSPLSTGGLFLNGALLALLILLTLFFLVAAAFDL